MTSTPPSHSEGEIFTSDSEKASQTLPSRNGTSVDRRTRTNVAPVKNPRSRSRSPYRALRGEKRRRDDGHTNPAKVSHSQLQKVRDESDRYLFDRNHGRLPHIEHSPSSNSRHHRAFDYKADDGRSYKRPRTSSRSRSRSPFRHSHLEGKPIRAAAYNHSKVSESDEEVQASRNGGRPRDEQSVSGRSKPSGVAPASKSNAKMCENQSLQVESKNHINVSADKYVLHHHCYHETEPWNSAKALALIETETETEFESIGTHGAVDEAALIEERRKRREALKAKYRNQETPLLVQALRPGTDAISSGSSSVRTSQAAEQSSQPTTLDLNKDSSHLGSGDPISPQTPREPFHSPGEMDFEQGENLANSYSCSVVGDEEEPSAADYDPTVDMQEERARHDKLLFNENISMPDNAERKLLEQHEIGPELSHPTASRDQADDPENRKDPFDMFADDDDDMFAEAPPKPEKPISATDAKTGQALDVKMMDNWDDAEGYYMTIPGELFESRYHVLQNLGRGMFSSVVRATDTKTNKLVAIKIVRNNDTMRKAGIKEIGILKDLAASDAEDKKHIIRLERSFEHKGHLCMVFENLSLNLRELLKKFGRDVGINLKAIRAYAQQLFLGLSLLRKCQYLHADLKPDNILVNDARNVLKICDLGSASSIEENITAPYLVSRFYRAPEIILGVPYDYGIDMWSVGCTLFELYTGKILFTGRNNNAMLRSIMECRGKFPNKVLRKGNLTYQYFDDLLNFQSIEEDKLTGRTVTKALDIKAKPVRGLKERLTPKGKRMDEQERIEIEFFADLLDKCLDLRGDKRITPSEALRHPFVTRAKV